VFKRLDVPKERVEFLRPHEVRETLEAALRHDADTVLSRDEEQRLRSEARARGITRKAMAAIQPRGTTPKYEPIAPFVAFCLLSGARLGEALGLEWDRVDLDALDSSGKRTGEIHLEGWRLKTKQYRTIDLAVSPALRKLLATMHLAGGGKGSVFGLTEGLAEAAAKRLKAEYSAPHSFGWQACRRTCATYLTNAPGIFGGASAYRSAAQLGHSVQVASRSYLGLVKGIPLEARTLEAAMQIEEQIERVVARISGSESAPARGLVLAAV
jgi:integrase